MEMQEPQSRIRNALPATDDERLSDQEAKDIRSKVCRRRSDPFLPNLENILGFRLYMYFSVWKRTIPSSEL